MTPSAMSEASVPEPSILDFSPLPGCPRNGVLGCSAVALVHDLLSLRPHHRHRDLPLGPWLFSELSEHC
jgi:hypothetical protein